MGEPILVAAAPAGVQRLQRALRGYRLVVAGNTQEATEALAHIAFAGVILGVQFDESRMLEVLDYMRADERYRSIPAVCIIGTKGRLGEGAISAFDQAAKALDARRVLDMEQYPDDAQGDDRLRRELEFCLVG
jgi:PleD family two-component response regulator